MSIYFQKGVLTDGRVSIMTGNKRFTTGLLLTVVIVIAAFALSGCGSLYTASVDEFAIYSADSVVATGTPSTISGSVGVAAGTIEGFPPSIIETDTGELISVDASATARMEELQGLYDSVQETTDTVSISGDLSAQTLDPNFYVSDTETFTLNGTLTLNGPSETTTDFPYPVVLFRCDGPLDITAGSDVLLSTEATSSDILWFVSGDVNIGTGTNFVGSIIASGAITVEDSCTIEGRLVSLSGPVTLQGNDTINVPEPLDLSWIPTDTVPVDDGDGGGGSGSTTPPPTPTLPRTGGDVVKSPMGITVASLFVILFAFGVVYEIRKQRTVKSDIGD